MIVGCVKNTANKDLLKTQHLLPEEKSLSRPHKSGAGVANKGKRIFLFPNPNETADSLSSF